MSGIAGFVQPDLADGPARSRLQRMQQLQAANTDQVPSDLDGDGWCWGATVLLRGDGGSIGLADGRRVWLDGEVQRVGGEPADLSHSARLLVEAVDGGPDLLRRLDGSFAACVYEPAHRRVHLVTDRYGTRQLYTHRTPGGLVWSSEIKAMLALPEFPPKVDAEAVAAFVEVGHYIEDRTCFSGVTMVPPATMVTFEVQNGGVHDTSVTYWRWDDIHEGACDSFDAAARELGSHFRRAVARCCAGTQPGVLLSGGLDSRAILAAAPSNARLKGTVTFGRAGCDDARIASRAAVVRGVPHRVVGTRQESWFEERLEGVWVTDGQLGINHMAGFEAVQAAARTFGTNLHGFGGDTIYGGGFLKSLDVALGPAALEAAADWFGCPPGALAPVARFEEKRLEYWLLNQRSRRFIQMGVKLLRTAQRQRFPFLDSRLVEFVYGVPAAYRFRNRLYEAMLLQCYPSYFRGIPWQKEGLPIGSPRPLRRAVSTWKRARGRAERLGVLPSRWAPRDRQMVPCGAWLREAPARRDLDGLFRSRSALFPEFVPRERVVGAWEAHLSGQDLTESLCRYAALEVWLQQVFEGRLRPVAGGAAGSGR